MTERSHRRKLGQNYLIDPVILFEIEQAINPQKNNLFFENDSIDLVEIISKVLEKYPQKVIEYNEGKIGLIGLFMGEIMKITKGKIDPKKINTELKKELEKRKK